MRFLLIIASIFIPLVSTVASNDYLHTACLEHQNQYNLFTPLSFFSKNEILDSENIQFPFLNKEINMGVEQELDTEDTNQRVRNFANVAYVKVIDVLETDSQFKVIGEIEVKAKEKAIIYLGDGFARKNIKRRALKKSRLIAALMGGELVHVTNYKYSGGGYDFIRGLFSFKPHHIPNKLSLEVKVCSKFSNTVEEGLSLLKDTSDFEVVCTYFHRNWRLKLSKSLAANELHVDSIKLVNGLVYLYGRMTGTMNVNCFRLVSMNEKYFYLYYTRKERHYQIQVRR